MNILYSVNDKFVPQVGAGICSICENNLDIDSILIHVFSIGVSDIHKKQLNDLVNLYNRNICFYEIDDLRRYFNFTFDTKGWNFIVMARLVLDKILPENIDRIIYLDGDTIVRGSLKNLWDIDMGSLVVGGCIEPTVNRKHLKSLSMNGVPYINAGVLLIDLQKWKQEKTGDCIISFIKMHNGSLFSLDQDAINGALKGKIYYINLKYNYCNTYDYYNYNTLRKLVRPAQYISKQEFDLSVENPVVIHYLGEERPWREGNRHRFRNEFLKYLAKTPFIDMEFEKGWKFYFKCFYIFNYLMTPFPVVRYKIITSLIPLFMKYRSRQLRNGIS